MKKEKKQIVLNGSLLRPLSVGRGALLHAGGNIYHTLRVVTILEESEDCVRFETQNSHYHLSMSPFPLAAVSPLPVRWPHVREGTVNGLEQPAPADYSTSSGRGGYHSVTALFMEEQNE
jgi:hypothetical protein